MKISNLEVDILSFASTLVSCDRFEIFRTLGGDNINTVDLLIDNLVCNGLLSCDRMNDNYGIAITPEGISALEIAKQEREQQAKDERQQRFQNKVSVASVLVPLVTFVLGLLVDYWTGIVGIVFSLFK